MDSIYLDYNATCPLAEEVQAAISQALSKFWANPSSSNAMGISAKHHIEASRQNVASMVNCAAEEIVFTSGGTEANNLVVTSSIEFFLTLASLNRELQGLKPHFVTSSIEHDSVSLPLKHYYGKNLLDLSIVPVDPSTGFVHVEEILKCIKPSTCLITIMMANNETGVVQPVEEIGRRLEEINSSRNIKILFHTDAAQAIGKIPVDVNSLKVDYLTIVGHKFYGPRIGALYAKLLKRDLLLYPNLFGGGQERGYRPGTENTPMIIGLGAAALLVKKHLLEYSSHFKEIRDFFELELKKRNLDTLINFRDSQRLPNTSSVVFVEIDGSGANLLETCTKFCASTGAACHDSNKASAILLACGIDLEKAKRTVRFSFGRETTKQEMEVVLDELEYVLSSKLIASNQIDKSLKRKLVDEKDYFCDNKCKQLSKNCST